MNDDKRIIAEFSESSKKKIIKDSSVYLKAYERKESFKGCYDRTLQRGKAKIDLEKPFKAKGFWKGLFDCGSWLEFRFYSKVDITKLQTANFCKRDKLCAACAVRRSYKQQQKFMKILAAAEDLKEKEWFYIVIPVRHTVDESYETVFKRLEVVRQKITKSMRNTKNGRGNNFWSQFTGGMFSTETTKTSNGWNVHLNLIINAPKGTKLALNRFSQAKPLEEWLKAKADGSYVHNIQKIDSSSDQEIRNALVEVLKYSLKFSSLSNSDLLEVYVRTYRKRLFGTFGNMRGVGIEDVELEGDSVPDNEFLELIFRRVGYQYKVDSVRKGKSDSIDKEEIETTDFNDVLKYLELY